MAKGSTSLRRHDLDLKLRHKENYLAMPVYSIKNKIEAEYLSASFYTGGSRNNLRRCVCPFSGVQAGTDVTVWQDPLWKMTMLHPHTVPIYLNLWFCNERQLWCL